MNKPTFRTDIQRGFGNDERPVTKVLWDRDSRPKIKAMEETGNYEPERKHVDYKRYYDQDYFRQEIEKVWLKTWLFACREEDLPNVGDRLPLDVGPVSFMIIRDAEDSFKAFFNACIHRGARLCDKEENVSSIKCPYHGWEWNNSGVLKRIPSHWDFKHVTPITGGLRQVRLERWGGFVFVNADADAPPLMKALGPIPSHFAEFAPEKRYTASRFRKSIDANWKIAQEAFMESYHVYQTHPEGVPYNGDSQTQYDIWTDENGHVGRQVTPSAVPSMLAPADATPIAAGHVYAAIMKQWHYPDAVLPTIDPDKNIRAQISDWHRQVQKDVYGVDRDAMPDAVMVDSSLYFFFPNSTFWLSESLPFTYQFTPHATDPNKCYFEVRMLLPYREGAPRPPSSPTVEVSPTETIAERVPAFNFLGVIFDQDMANMPLIQKGVHSADPKQKYSMLGTYQEMIMQHWHDVLDKMMEASS
ncbi:MAG: aromatic ring-hydroxylating dioxygenase subunit alpha [Caulobacterales bacterium]